MSNLIAELAERGAKPPRWLASNTAYLTLMGSQAYGCADSKSDTDVYGFCFPPKADVFPHLAGHIPGFGRQVNRFEQYQEAGLRSAEGREVDLTVYSIVRFFHLAMENNPNILDALFTPVHCVLHSTAVAEMVRANRKLFLHAGCFFKLRGYSFGQASKIHNQESQVVKAREFEDAYGIPHHMTLEEFDKILMDRSVGVVPEPYCRMTDMALQQYRELLRAGEAASKRFYSRKLHGYDTKFAMHLVRLVLQCRDALSIGTMELDKHGELLRAVRNGEWGEKRVLEWFQEMRPELEGLYETCHAGKGPLPDRPNESAIKALLLTCLEHHYGSLDKCVAENAEHTRALLQIRDIIGKAGL